MRKRSEEPEDRDASSDERMSLRLDSGSLRSLLRNAFSQAVAAFRNSHRLQPLHRRYGPIKYRYVLPAMRRLQQFIKPDLQREDPDTCYQLWTRRCEELRYDRERAIKNIDRFAHKPTISILLPVYNTNPAFLRQALDSVRNQYYPHWELCICDDGSTEPQVREILYEYAAKDARIKTALSDVNEGIARASNRALSLATGEFIGLLDHDDALTPDGLFEIVTALQHTDADLIYSDEDRLDSKGRRSRPHFKPAWCPDLLLSCMYLAHFCVYRRAIVELIGGFREGFDGSQDYDLALRFTEATNRIVHIPKILYHWRDDPSSASATSRARPAVETAGRLALKDAMRRRGLVGEVECQRVYGFYRVRRAIKGAGRVSIVILALDDLGRLRKCLESIKSKTDYSDYEILIVHTGNLSREVREYLATSPHRVIEDDAPYSSSRLNNLAAREAAGEYLLFLSADAEVFRSDWLGAMVEHAQRPEVGAVGAKLLYPDGRIQHAGVLPSVAGTAGNANRYIDGFTSGGYLNYANVIRNYSAVSGACLMIRRELFLKAGGFDEQEFAVLYNDLDLNLRLRDEGYLIVYTPYAVLYHDEPASGRDRASTNEEASLRDRWGSRLVNDYYYNPNLSSTREDFSQDYSKPEALICGSAQDSSKKIVCRLDGETRVGHEFFFEQENLSAIGIHLESVSDKRSGTLRLHLRESHLSTSDLATADLDVALMRENEWQVFAFEPVRDSRAKHFYFFVELLGDSSGNQFGIWGSADSDSRDVHFEGHLATRGAISFRAYFSEQFR